MMPIFRCSVLAAAIVFMTAAESFAVGSTVTSDESDHLELRALVPIYEQAIANGKPDELLPHLDPSFSAVMLTGDSLEGPESVNTYWTNLRNMLGEGGKYQVKVNVSAPALIDHDLALASGSTDDTVDAKGRHYDFHSNWTAVCRKGPDGWKLLRIQATIDPIYNPFVKTAIRQTMLTSSGIAGAVGLLIGLIIGALFFRRREAVGTHV